MTTPLPETTLAWLRQTAKFEGAVTAQAILHTLERLEALEQRPVPGTVELAAPTFEAAPVATDEELRRVWQGTGYTKVLRPVYDLGREHGALAAAQPAPPVAPAGGLVERVADVLGHYGDASARAAIREVAAWIRSNQPGRWVAERLEREAGR